MQVYDHARIDAALDWRGLIAALRDALAEGAISAPERQVFAITMPDGQEASLLVMPAWKAGVAVGVKAVTFFPGNAARGRATINAGYMMFDGDTGELKAVLEGDALTARRTAAASALAADYLARRDARRLLVVGTGQLAAIVGEAHCAVRAYERVEIWGRSGAKAQRVAAGLAVAGLPAAACEDLEAACRAADVVACATASQAPLIAGAWLGQGTHLDLIGAFRQDMRESDDRALTQADVFVDGRAGAVLAGDLAQPIADGIWDAGLIRADLSELARGDHPGREDPSARTVFKSVGLSLEDFVAAQMAVR